MLTAPFEAAYGRFRWCEAMLEEGGTKEVIEPTVEELVELASDLGATRLATAVERAARRAGIRVGADRSRDKYALTQREQEVLLHLSRGASNRRIAKDLYISEKTASVHVSNILRKMGVSNRGQAAAVAIREQLVTARDLQVDDSL